MVYELEKERRRGRKIYVPVDERPPPRDIVDLLVAVLAVVVPRSLLRRAVEVVGGEEGISRGDSRQQQQQHEEYLTAMEQVCLNAACTSSDILRRHYLPKSAAANLDFDESPPPSMEDRHVHNLVGKVLLICEHA